MKQSTLLCLAFCCGYAGLRSAQSKTTDMVSGTITDSSGAVVPNAKVPISNNDTGLSRAAATDRKV